MSLLIPPAKITVNVKIIIVIIVLLISTTAYNHWLSLREENQRNIAILISTTDFLASKKPPDFFSDFMASPANTALSQTEQVAAVNRQLQPLLNSICPPASTVKFGFYSRFQESIVAIGPDYDKSLMLGFDSCPIKSPYAAREGQLFEKSNSIIWYGSKTYIYLKPLEENGVIVGYAFAAINQDVVSSAVWHRTLNTFSGAFLMLLICICLFREFFFKLKQDLLLLSQSIISGRSQVFSGEIAEISAILQNISEQTEKMTRLDRLNIIGEMAAGIAHEIRNPLTTVRGLLQFIGRKPEFIPHQENFCLMINELDRANGIITEFLSLAKNKSMVFARHNLNTIIQELMPLLQADALCNRCHIILALSDLPAVNADQNSIRQLLLNLVRNAMDAMPQGGNIEISTTAGVDGICLAITDWGMGIPPHVQDKLGTPFFTTKDNGTGLGLAICYRIAERHDARITISSRLGYGTTFSIWFKTA